MGRKQYVDHPDIPGRPWFKITLNGALDFKQYLDLKDLDEITAKLQKAWSHIEQRKEN